MTRHRMGKAKRHRSWFLTIYAKTLEECQQILQDIQDDIRFAYIANEYGSSGDNPHRQGVVCFTKVQPLTKLQSLFGKGNHFEPKSGTDQQCITYCSKEHKEYFQIGEPLKPGKRTDIAAMHERVKAGASNTELADEMPDTYYRYFKAVDHVRQELQYKDTPNWREVQVCVYYGSTGTGKTRSAMDRDSVYCLDPPYQWFDQYTNEKRLVIDDYDSTLPITQLLKMLDGYKYKCPVKGSFVWAQWTEVVITSNIIPTEWHPKAKPAHVDALWRRIDEVWEFHDNGDEPTCYTSRSEVAASITRNLRSPTSDHPPGLQM